MKIQTGRILKIPLSNKLGFAYAKYIDLTKFPNINLPSLIKVYEFWTQNNDFDLEEISRSNYLIQPILVAGIYPVLRKKKWKIIGQIQANGDENEIPHFRAHEPIWAEENSATSWCYIENCNVNNRIETSLKSIEHLERWGAEATENIEIRVTIQIIKKEGLNFKDYFDMEDETVQYQYKMAMESPLLSELPLAMHGKARV